VKCFASILFLFSVTFVSAQYTVISSFCESEYMELQMTDDVLYILGNDGYFGKLNDSKDGIIELTSPGLMGYTRENLHVIHPDSIYVSSHKDFPHHGYILESTDGGVTWNEILDTTDILFTEFIMFTPDQGAVITTFYRSLLTSNNGLNWEEDNHGLIGSSASLRINDSTGIIGITEDFNLTTNGGESWESSSFVQSVPQAFYAENKDSIFAVTNGVTGVFFSYTMNFGESAWVNRSIPDFSPRGVCVKAMDEVYVVGLRPSTGTGQILKTTDLGLTWLFFDTGIEHALDDMIFIDDSTAVIGGDNGTLIKWNRYSSFESVSVQEEDISYNFNIYPNPSSQHQTISWQGVEYNGVLTIELYNHQGSLVLMHTEDIVPSTSSTTVDIGNLPSGVYTYIIRFNDERVIRKKCIKY